jgi:biopolymer transport protein ExbD
MAKSKFRYKRDAGEMMKRKEDCQICISYRDINYDDARKEIVEYFQEKGEAYPSEIEEDLELDYKLICEIVDELKREGRLKVL